MKKQLMFILTLLIVTMSMPVAGFASEVSVDLNGKTFTISNEEIERLAKLNNVDPQELKNAIESGVDDEGRFSPFSKVKTLDNGITQEQLDEMNKEKLSSTGEPLIKPLNKPKAFKDNSLSGYIERKDQDTTAYVWTGNKTANGNWPELGIVACHREKDIYGGTSNTPVIPFGKKIYLDRYVWLPDGVGYKSDFKVDDTGRGPGKTDYWLDIYYGTDEASALIYGNIVLTYNQET